MKSILAFFRKVRRSIKSKSPYVRRRQLRKSESKHADLVRDCSWGLISASEVNIKTIKSFDAEMSGELCFFVTYAPEYIVKPHVVHHIKKLVSNGIKVVLIINTDLDCEDFNLDADLINILSGAFFRENKGFDFAAWAHIYCLLNNKCQITRMYWINDSIVGPLNDTDFSRIIERIRASKAGLIGLTENLYPQRHVQSFFLVFNGAALSSDKIDAMIKRTLCFSSKEFVIDAYEINLTKHVESFGLTVEALFPTLSTCLEDSNDTCFRWEQLLSCGFPYIKTSVLKGNSNKNKSKSLIPRDWQNCKM